MFKTRIKILVVVLILGLALVAYVTANHRATSVAHATAESPQPCDLEAAHPADIQRLAPGKSRSVRWRAASACR